MAEKFISIKSNFDSEIKNFSELKKHIKLNSIENLDKYLNKAIDELKKLLKEIVQQKIRIKSDTTVKTEETITPQLNIPKSKNDIIEQVFGQDISKSDYINKKFNVNNLNDNNNVFVINNYAGKGGDSTLGNRRVKIWQDVNESSTYSSEESKVKNRLIKGIVIDARTGKAFKLNPNDVKNQKLDCSKDTGETVNSETKFNAYKNSTKISRTKNGDPGKRFAIWTVKQADLDLALSNALPIDDVVDKILENEHDTAIGLLNQFNKNGELTENIRKIEDLKTGKNLTPSTEALNDILKLINNIKLEKKISENLVTYTLFSSYNEEIEKDEVFFDEFKKQIFLWKVGNEPIWVKAVVDGIVKALKTYEGSSKLVVT